METRVQISGLCKREQIKLQNDTIVKRQTMITKICTMIKIADRGDRSVVIVKEIIFFGRYYFTELHDQFSTENLNNGDANSFQVESKRNGKFDNDKNSIRWRLFAQFISISNTRISSH